MSDFSIRWEINPALIEPGPLPLTRAGAVTAMAQRLATQGWATGDGASELASAFVAQLGDDQLYPSVIRDVNLRPLIGVLVESVGHETINGVPVGAKGPAVRKLLDNFTKTMANELRVVKSAEGLQEPELSQKVDAELADQLTNRTLSKQIESAEVLAAAASAVGPGEQSPLAPYGFKDELDRNVPTNSFRRFADGQVGAELTADQLRQLISSDPSWANNLIAIENAKIDARNQGVADVPAGAYSVPYEMGPPAPRSGGGFEARAISLIDARDWMLERQGDELAAVQDKLVAAGYLKDSDVQYRGQATDQATYSAFMRALGDSVILRKPLMPMLAEKTVAQQEFLARNQQPYQVTDPVGIESDAQKIAFKLLGRPLRGSELSELTGFIHGLQRQQQDNEASMVGTGGDIYNVDVGAQAENWIRDERATDVASNGVLDTFAAVRKAMKWSPSVEARR